MATAFKAKVIVYVKHNVQYFRLSVGPCIASVRCVYIATKFRVLQEHWVGLRVYQASARHEQTLMKPILGGGGGEQTIQRQGINFHRVFLNTVGRLLTT